MRYNDDNKKIIKADLYYYFYFISTFILLTCRKVTEALIYKVSNYPDLFIRFQDITVCNLIEI